jgi:hypothetical protein
VGMPTIHDCAASLIDASEAAMTNAGELEIAALRTGRRRHATIALRHGARIGSTRILIGRNYPYSLYVRTHRIDPSISNSLPVLSFLQ